MNVNGTQYTIDLFNNVQINGVTQKRRNIVKIRINNNNLLTRKHFFNDPDIQHKKMQNIITGNNYSNNNIYNGTTTATTNPTPQPANGNFYLHPNYTLGLNLAHDQSPEPPLRMDLTMHETTSNKNNKNIENIEKTKDKDKGKIANAMTTESIQSQHTRKMYPSDYSTTMTYDMANEIQNYNTDNNFGLHHNGSIDNRDNPSAFNDVLNIYNLESCDHGEP